MRIFSVKLRQESFSGDSYSQKTEKNRVMIAIGMDNSTLGQVNVKPPYEKEQRDEATRELAKRWGPTGKLGSIMDKAYWEELNKKYPSNSGAKRHF